MMLPTISLRVERWKFNKEYGVYASNLGNFKDRYKRRLPIKLNNGYCYIETERGWKTAHRIVMITWKPIPNAEDLTVDHLNHNKRDNSIYNLEWVTYEENQRRAAADQLMLKENKTINIENNGNVYILLDEVSIKATKKAKKEEYRNSIKGYSLDGEGCYTKDEIINKLVELRGKNSRKNTEKAIKHLEDGTNQSASKTFGKNTKHIVKIIFK